MESIDNNDHLINESCIKSKNFNNQFLNILLTYDYLKLILDQIENPIIIIRLIIVLFKLINNDLYSNIYFLMIDKFIHLFKNKFDESFHFFKLKYIYFNQKSASEFESFTSCEYVLNGNNFSEKYNFYLKYYYDNVKYLMDNSLKKEIIKTWFSIKLTNQLEEHDIKNNPFYLFNNYKEYLENVLHPIEYSQDIFSIEIYNKHQNNLYIKVFNQLNSIDLNKINLKYLLIRIKNIISYFCLNCGYYKYCPVLDETKLYSKKHSGICVYCLSKKRLKYKLNKLNIDHSNELPYEEEPNYLTTDYERDFNNNIAKCMLETNDKEIYNVFKIKIV